MEVRDIVKPAVVIAESASFREAVTKMVKEQTNSLLVVGDDGQLVGEIHMSDILDAIVPGNLDVDIITSHFTSNEVFEAAVADAEDTPVEFFMSTDINPVTTDASLMTIASVAVAERRAHIPVVDKDNRPIGIISRRGIKHIVAHALGIKDNF